MGKSLLWGFSFSVGDFIELEYAGDWVGLSALRGGELLEVRVILMSVTSSRFAYSSKWNEIEIGRPLPNPAL